MGHYRSILDIPPPEVSYSNKCQDGECSNCGECCTDLLPLTRGELEKIRRYVKKHNIKEHRQAPFWDRGAVDLTCPFRNQHTQRCDIYPARPLICRHFICSKPLMEARDDRDLIHESRNVYSLRWEIFRNPECHRLVAGTITKAIMRY